MNITTSLESLDRINKESDNLKNLDKEIVSLEKLVEELKIFKETQNFDKVQIKEIKEIKEFIKYLEKKTKSTNIDDSISKIVGRHIKPIPNDIIEKLASKFFPKNKLSNQFYNQIAQKVSKGRIIFALGKPIKEFDKTTVKELKFIEAFVYFSELSNYFEEIIEAVEYTNNVFHNNYFNE